MNPIRPIVATLLSAQADLDSAHRLGWHLCGYICTPPNDVLTGYRRALTAATLRMRCSQVALTMYQAANDGGMRAA